jgi:KTSC domain
MTFPTRLIRLPKRRSTAQTHRADSPGEALPVASNAIARLEYDRDTQELTVSFARGGSYTIAGISEIEAHRWASARSPGKYFNAYVRDTDEPHRRS